MSVVHLVPQPAGATGRGGYAPALPQVATLAELAPYLSRRLARCRRAGEQLALLWIELEPLPSPRVDADAAEVLTELMRTASLRARNRVRGTDEVVQVGLQGFAVLLPTAGHAEAALVAARLRQTLTGAYELEGRRNYLAVSLGDAIFPDAGITGTELADAAQRSLAVRQGG